MNCEYCQQTFSTKGNLSAHQKSAKYCLSLQGIENNNFKCDYCEKTFTVQKILNEHIHSCKQKKKKEKEEENFKSIENIKTIRKLEKEVDKLKKCKETSDHYEKQLLEKDKYIGDKERYYMEQINNLKETIEKLEAKLEKFEDAVISSKKPTNTTNNNIVVANTLILNDTERFKAIIEEKLTKNVVCNGQRGLAKFAVENLLKDADGKLMYKCVDPSRHNFEFTNSDGIVEKDVKAIKLKRALIEGDVIVKAKNAGNELWTREDGSMDNDRYTASSGKVMEIMTVDRDDTKFRTELSALTS
jgi:hypothetical protein